MLQCLDLTCSLQVIFVPFLSSFLKWRDTTILMLAVSFIITGFFLTAFSSQLWVLYVCYCLFMLWNTVTTTCREDQIFIEIFLFIYHVWRDIDQLYKSPFEGRFKVKKLESLEISTQGSRPPPNNLISTGMILRNFSLKKMA